MTTAAAPQKPPASPPAPSAEPPPEPEHENVLSAWLSRHQFALRRLHSLTGILFGGYVFVHLLVNATLLEGVRYDGQKTVYQQQVDRIHGLPFLEVIGWTVILLPIIYHTIYGFVVMMSGRPNVDRYGYALNWAYLLQRISALVLVLFIAFHYLSMKGAFGGELGQMLRFVPVDAPGTQYSEATQSVVNHFHAAWWVGWVVYPIGLLAATFHTANGFWTAGITWGLMISARAQRMWLYACAGLFVFMTACGFVAMTAALAAEPTAEPIVGQRIIDPRIGEKTPDAETIEELEAPGPGTRQAP